MIKIIIENILNKKSEYHKIQMIEELTDEFRGDRDPSELLELLEQDDENILNIALYILGEINIGNNSILKEVFKKLKVLSVHKKAQVRYKTLINLASLTHEVNADELKNIYKNMSQDLNEGISKTAKELLRTGHLNF